MGSSGPYACVQQKSGLVGQSQSREDSGLEENWDSIKDDPDWLGSRTTTKFWLIDRLSGRLMHCLGAFPAKRNQISLDIVTKCATPSQVVNIEILEAATYLTAPVIVHQDFFTQPRIRDGRYSNSRSSFGRWSRSCRFFCEVRRPICCG